MTKFHISNKGVPAKCTAITRPCPYGGEEVHFPDAQSCQKAADEQNSKKYGPIPLKAPPPEEDESEWQIPHFSDFYQDYNGEGLLYHQMPDGTTMHPAVFFEKVCSRDGPKPFCAFAQYAKECIEFDLKECGEIIPKGYIVDKPIDGDPYNLCELVGSADGKNNMIYEDKNGCPHVTTGTTYFYNKLCTEPLAGAEALRSTYSYDSAWEATHCEGKTANEYAAQMLAERADWKKLPSRLR